MLGWLLVVLAIVGMIAVRRLFESSLQFYCTVLLYGPDVLVLVLQCHDSGLLLVILVQLQGGNQGRHGQAWCGPRALVPFDK